MAALYSLTRFLVWTALIIGLVIGAARATALRWVRLPTNDPVLETSVLPTLEGGDLILLWRLGKPRFGDLVLCPEPGYPERFVIGRIAGESGDQVRIKDSKATVNGDAFAIERSCDPPVFTFLHPDRPSEEVSQQCMWEAIGNHLHMMGGTGAFKILPEDRQYDVPEGQWFLLSDNRIFPYDSRDYGFVAVDSCNETVIGRLVSRRGWNDAPRRLTYVQ